MPDWPKAPFIKILMALFAAAALLAAGMAPAHAQSAAQPSAEAKGRTRLVILGAGAGRTSYRGFGAGGMSAAVQVGTDVYVVDFGSGWYDAFFQAGLGSPGDASVPGGLETLRAGFVTHLHADHVADYGRLIQFATSDGLQKRRTPVEIFGPARVTESSQIFFGLRARAPFRLITPENPSPGIRDMTERLIAAYAADLNDNMSDGGKPSPYEYLRVNDISIPSETGASPVQPSPRMSPFRIYADENVTVSATLVNHAPMYPAFAFRFDTADGAIVFSGDTSRNENLIELAHNADVLVHEAIDMSWPRRSLPEPRSAADEAKLRHLLEAHTDVAELGSIAEAAGVRMLVLSHLAPPTTADENWLSQIKGYRGKAVIGRRLFSVALPLK